MKMAVLFHRTTMMKAESTTRIKFDIVCKQPIFKSPRAKITRQSDQKYKIRKLMFFKLLW